MFLKTPLNFEQRTLMEVVCNSGDKSRVWGSAVRKKSEWSGAAWVKVWMVCSEGEHKWNYDENHVKKSCLSQFQSYQDFELYITAIEDSWRDAD